ncbi:hypothetical protein ACFE04_011461 [Oxalis oulophora]
MKASQMQPTFTAMPTFLGYHSQPILLKGIPKNFATLHLGRPLFALLYTNRISIPVEARQLHQKGCFPCSLFSERDILSIYSFPGFYMSPLKICPASILTRNVEVIRGGIEKGSFGGSVCLEAESLSDSFLGFAIPVRESAYEEEFIGGSDSKQGLKPVRHYAVAFYFLSILYEARQEGKSAFL